MSNYRRLISYIYEYEGKTKGRNVGFAKLEARGGQCKINVNVKKIFIGGDAGVYLLASGGEISLGKMFIRGGAGEFRTTLQVDNVDGNGVDMDACYGLAIHEPEDDWRTYRTIWEDEVAYAAEIELAKAAPKEAVSVLETAEKAVAEIEREMARQEGAQTSVPQEIEILDVSGRPGEKKSFQAPAAVLKPQAHRPEPGPERPPMPPGPGPERPPMPQGPGPERPPMPPGPGPERPPMPQGPGPERPPMPPGPGPERPPMPQGPGPERPPMPPAPGPERPPMPAPGPVMAPGWGGPQRTAPMPPRVIKEEKPDLPRAGIPGELEGLTLEEDPEVNPGKVWDCFEKAYPKIQAFDSDHGCIILVIKPQDIGLLPREVWVYGNNSFLLHGYYNYRYIILARLENPKGKPRFLLGIPGHYYSNEKYMAAMFGFPNFVLSKNQPAGDGRFGYWYTDIQLGNVWEESKKPDSKEPDNKEPETSLEINAS